VNKEGNDNLNSSAVIAFNNEYQWLYNYVANNTGLPATMFGVLQAFDQIRTQKANGYDLPDWVNDYYFNKMGFVYYNIFDFWFSSQLYFRLKNGT